MIVAEIRMGEDVIADPLAGAQPAAMANHQPRLGPQHREMVANRLGVRRADADVDEGDAAAVGRDQVIGGHLVPPPRAVGDERAGVHAGLVDIEPRGARERGVAPLPNLRPRPSDEFVNITVVVGEQDISLEMFGRGAGVVAEACEAEVGAQRVEQRERL